MNDNNQSGIQTPRYKIETRINHDKGLIIQDIEGINPLGRFMRSIIDTRETQIKESLIALGWTPPIDEKEVKPKKKSNRERFIDYIKFKHNLKSDNSIIIHSQEIHGQWVEYSIVGLNLGHSQRGQSIIRLTAQEVFSHGTT